MKSVLDHLMRESFYNSFYEMNKTLAHNFYKMTEGKNKHTENQSHLS